MLGSVISLPEWRSDNEKYVNFRVSKNLDSSGFAISETISGREAEMGQLLRRPGRVTTTLSLQSDAVREGAPPADCTRPSRRCGCAQSFCTLYAISLCDRPRHDVSWLVAMLSAEPPGITLRAALPVVVSAAIVGGSGVRSASQFPIAVCRFGYWRFFFSVFAKSPQGDRNFSCFRHA
jgi:hypothetical protein